MIQRFEFTFELAWKTLKDYFKAVDVNVIGPRDSIEQAFADEIIMDGETWMKMLDARNKTTHTYKESDADKIAADIKNKFIFAFKELDQTFNKL